MAITVATVLLCFWLIIVPGSVNGYTASSGNRNEGTHYTFSCNSGYFIQMTSATYYTCSSSSVNVLSTLQSHLDGHQSKQLYISDSLFSASSSTCTAYVSANWNCGRNGGWSNWGSWSDCLVICGGGISVTRTRACDNPTFDPPGTYCSGDGTETQYCNTHDCDDDAHLINHRGPWTLVYKIPASTTVSGYNDFYSHFADSTTSSTLNDGNVAVMRDFSSGGSPFKSSKLLQWQSGITISAVRLSVFKSGKEVAYVIFDAFGKGKMDWFNCANIIGSSYTDIASYSHNYCGFSPYTSTYKRNFYINGYDTGCSNTGGWIMLKDFGSTSGCSAWEASGSSTFIKYSTSTTIQNLYTGSVSTGDSLAIFIMEWHMVFKGVQGVTPTAGSLETLWTGTTVENDNDDSKTTITTSPGSTVKSSLVEDWEGYFTMIDLVKYAHFTSGHEKAYVVFDGRGTTKTSWFADGKEIYSSYSDIITDTPATSGITGDSYRKFAIIRTSSSCSGFYGWMMVLDVGGSVQCSFDNNVQTRPYFLYSSLTTDNYAQSGGSWYSAGFPAAHTLGIFVKGFYPVMKWARGQSISPATSVYNLWTGTYTLNEFTTSAHSFAASTATYKSSIVDSWTSYYIKAVRVSLYTSGVEQAYVVFDAHGSDKSSWFDCDRILYTNYVDLNRRTTSLQYCSLAGDSGAQRRFFIEYGYSSCGTAGGWIGVFEGSNCAYDNKATSPFAMYSDTSPARYEYNDNMAVADTFVVSIAMDDFCDFSPCQNGGTCYHRGVKYECVCDGAYYGLDCADLDGNFTTWTDWSTCSTTCYAWGTHTRSRTCTNPTPAGPNGQSCTGDTSETQGCIPNLDTCSVYNTGDITVDSSYTMVCKPGLVIFVTTAFYGHGSTCFDTDPLSDVRVVCQGKDTNCTITFNDATFGGNPCSSHSVTNYGSATMYCVDSLKLSTLQGPWRLVFKAPTATAPPSGHADIASFYLSSDTINDGSESVMTDFSSGGSLYKSALLNEWGVNRTFSAVRYSIYKNNEEVAYIVYNALGKGKDTWMDCDNILYSSYTDMRTVSKNYCVIKYTDSTTFKHSFYVSATHGGCDPATGWMFMKDYGSTSGCAGWAPFDDSRTEPYAVYSTASTLTQWSTGNVGYADAVAIFVQDWHMVFKGVDGVTPTAGDLETLWEGSTTEYDGDETVKTINKIPAVTYKSAVVEDWSSNWTIIDQVKYSFFKSGVEEAHVVFDGINTDKNTWMDPSKFLYSLEYGSTVNATTASISGDGTRAFSVIHESGSCSAMTAWMLVLDDPSGSTTCSFDNNVRTRPYFLYSNTGGSTNPESGASWDSVNFPYADTLGIFIIGWFPVMKVANGESVSPATGIYNLWTGTYTLNEYVFDAYSMSSGTPSYKSSIVDSWSSYYKQAVRVSFFVAGEEIAFVVFDAHASTKTSFFNCDRILYTSYADLTRDTSVIHCSVAGNNNRRFFIEETYGSGCSYHFGWFGIIEGSGCSYDSKGTTPFPLCSDASFSEANDDMIVPDTFAISIARDNMCNLVTCLNGGTCYDWGARFECVCAGDYYGGQCQNLNGGWSDWTPWTDCSTTCYAQGTQTRERTCSNPTTAGDGVFCIGYGNQTLYCVPDNLDICSQYSTGDIAEGDNYTLVCPPHSLFYIHIYDASYGNTGQPCLVSDPVSAIRTACHGSTTSCNVLFNDATFGGDPCSSYPSLAKSGYITYYCARSQPLDEPRGPWRLVFKAPRATSLPSGHTDILSLYSASGPYNEGVTAAMTDFSASGSLYKSAILDQWGSNLTVTAVKLAIFTSGSESASVTFDATGKGKIDWFDCSRIIDSSWIDLVETGNKTCTLNSADTYKRIFQISSDYTGCDNETGWFMFKDYGATSGCSSSDSTSTTMPYMLYSSTGLRTTWSSASKATGDCLAIFVMDWHMVFKAVAGDTSTGSLETLWGGTTLLNDGVATATSITNSPASGYKSSVVESWSEDFTFFDMVKYAYFSKGEEQAWIVFDGVGTSKTTWFQDSKILFSSYTDIDTVGKTTVSVTGDGIRSFAVIDEYPNCDGLMAWMMVSDYGSSTTCAFDNAGTKPYFIYSSTDDQGSPQAGSTYDSAAFPQAEVMGIFIHGWFPVMKVSKGFGVSPASGIYDLWSNTYTVNEYNDSLNAFSFASNTMSYKSSVVDSWSSYYIKAVRVSFFVGGTEQAYVVFDAHGSTKLNWLSCDRILYSSWTDLNRDAARDRCTMIGSASATTYFSVLSQYGKSACSTENGWFTAIDSNAGSCSWESKDSTYPHVVFSDTTTLELNTGFAVADVFGISVSMDNICDIVTCENGATCLDWGGRYSCSCDGDYYGHLCQNINGNYTAWSDWSDCSTTCYAQGVHSRNRTCTNPSPAGIGLDCTGIGVSDESQLCIPEHLDICDEYNTGDVPENTAYTMVCPSDFYIHVYAAFFGNGATCSDTSALADAQTACHQKTDSCVLTFSTTTFGSDPCSGHGVSNYGSATMFCAKHQQLDNWRGPWQLAFKVPKGSIVPSGHTDFNDFYSASGSFNEDDTTAKTDFSATGSVYKSALLDQWGDNLTVNAMRLSLFKSGKEEAYIVFDTTESTKSNWFDCSKIIDSSYHDIVNGNTTCTLNGGGTERRTFFVSSDYTGCVNETGWVMMKDYGATSGCSEWDSTTPTMPYIYYSGLRTRVQWSTADKVEADSIALFVLEWDMAFKGIQGLAPTTYTSLVNLWTSSLTENEYDTTAQTLTNSPSKAFKSGVVEAWSDDFTFIDMVKYSHFVGGVEKAWVVFDGVDTTKTSWFADGKILFSRYNDMKTASKTRSSITGDGMRSFALVNTESSCDTTTAWMFMLDYGTSYNCRFDRASYVTTKPYFLYSNTDAFANPLASNNWDSTNFPSADVLGVFFKGWFPVLKVAKGMDISPATGIYDLWTNTYTLNEYNDTNEAFSLAANTMTYKSSIVDTWSSFYFRAVRVSFYTSGSEVGYVVFDAHGSDKTSWLSCDRILYTSWTDLNRYATKDFCSVAGDSANDRRFFVENSLGSSCSVSRGWFGVVEASSGSCSWETTTTRPYAIYSSGTTMANNAAMSVADVFAISVSMDNICDIVTCENGATCLDWGGSYRCLCEDGYYGWLCQNLDGNYTTWTDWSDCSTTCYAEGTHYRTRTCTNPTPLGIGQDCLRYGEPSQTRNCIPTHLDVCSEYNTGDMQQDSSYLMICPSDFYIHVYSARYGNGTLCSDSNAIVDLRAACHLQTDQCNVTFSDTFFSGNPCTSHPTAVVTGSAKFYCAKRRERDNPRGPWRLVFKAPSGTEPPSPHNDLMELYDASGAYNEFDTSAMTDFSAGGSIYKSTMLDSWGVNTTVSAVKLSVFKNGREVQYVIFDAIGKDKTNWFDCDNIIESSWHDLPDGNRTCTKSTADTWKRNWFLQSDFPTCTNESGWFVFKDHGATSGCTEWDVTTSLPKIFYSQTPERVVWNYGNMSTADAMALFVMDWHMVFKGVESITPTAGSLAGLWTGTDTENDNDTSVKTLTKSPNLAYKSSLIENWDDPFTFIDMVKYAYFTGGVEKAYVVFDGRRTTKSSWFDSSKILFSSYSDIKTASIDHASISSDSRRTFLITHDVTTTCSNYQMWMAALDVGGSVYCAFDNAAYLGTARPNFLYSSTGQYAYPMSGHFWDSVNVPRADVMGVFIIGWYPLMKVARGVDLSPATGIYDLWTGTYILNEYNDTDTAFSFASSTMPYKSSVVDNWSNYYIKAIRVSFFVSGVEKAFVVFDAHGSDKNSWFNCDNILYTSWADVNRYALRDYCSVVGDSAKNRRMFMASSYEDDCSKNSGWFGVVEDSTTTCSWEQKATRPFAMYSDATSVEDFDDMALADVFAVSMSTDPICSIVECENGGTCYDWGARYRCFCDGYYYGWLCQNLDGNWTAWTDWSACSTSCYAIGTQYRYRNCTAPAPVGHGLDCGYPDLEVQTCVPDHDVCPEYNTGNLSESKNYTMICPVGFYIYVDDAYYGDGSNCYTTDAINRLRGYCHEQTDSCQFFFTDSYFGGDPCSSYPSAIKYGYAKLNCIKRDILDSYKGPWRLVFKAPSGKRESGYSDVKAYYDATASSTETNTDVTDKSDFSTSASVYKSKILDDWGTSTTAQAVRLSVWKSGKEVHYVVFDGFGKTKADFMDCSKILYSSWHDLDSSQNVTCQMREDDTKKRTFYLSRGGYNTCTNESGWLMYKDRGATIGCSEWDPTSGLPAIKYSTATEHVTWATGPTGDADALAIYVMDWFMAFKGVQGVTASTGSLKSLWESEDTENYLDTTAQTVSTAPGLTFKSSLLEVWLESFTFTELVKYGFYSGGAEVAFVIFDGRGTTKDSWFNCANILFSSYDDIISQTKSHCSIQGDDIRNFAILKQGGTSCASVQAWMMLSENSTEPCVFDRASNVEATPFFLYSSSSIYNVPQNGFSYYSAGMPAADTMGVFVKGWFPAFHIAYSGALYSASSIYDLYSGTYVVNEYNETAFSLDNNAMTFKSSAINQWTSLYIQAVRVSFFKNNAEAAYIVFDGHATTKTNWFDCDRILYSSYRDLTRETPTDYCSIAGDNSNRRFFLEASYGLDCSANSGWFGVVDGTGTCSWETLATPPFAMYSDANTVEENTAMAVADSFVISLAMDNICSIVDCLHGATCDDQGGRYDCICDGDYYGWLCQHLDGNWTAWSDWDTCSTTCYAEGGQNRYRNCTNPAPVGDGLYCPGVDIEFQYCIPDLPICSEYNTGNIQENGWYHMVCPSSYYIYVWENFYGFDRGGPNECSDPNAYTILFDQCHNVTNGSCRFFYDDVTYEDPCNKTYSKITNYGYSKLYCARDGVWNAWQPWSFCSVTCGGGTRYRERVCDNPTKVYPGNDCPDVFNDSKSCKPQDCPVCGDHYAGYDEPSNITVMNDTRSGMGYLLLDVNWDFPCCEVVQAFEFVPRVAGEIFFHIWRKVSSTRYELLHKTNYTINDTEIGSAINHSLPLKKRFSVRKGDFLGWYTPGENPIKYADCCCEGCPNQTWVAPLPSNIEVGDRYQWENLGTKLSDIAYALRFFTAPNTVPYVNQTLYDALVPDNTPIGGSVINYHITDDDIGDFDLLVHSFVDTTGLFELNTTFPGNIHIQTTDVLPSTYSVFELVLNSNDDCSNTATTTLTIMTYNAPPIFINLPDSIEVSEALAEEVMLFEIDAVDQSENDSVCCTLTEVIPGSLNFQLKFINQTYRLYTVENPVFSYKDISDYYKVYFCCSDDHGISTQFLEIFMLDVKEVVAYVPPTWFLTAITCSMVPVSVTFIFACMVLLNTMFCDAEIEYYYE